MTTVRGKESCLSLETVDRGQKTQKDTFPSILLPLRDRIRALAENLHELQESKVREDPKAKW